MVKQEQERKQDTYANGLLSGYLERERLRQAAQFVNTGDYVLDLACNEGAFLSYLPQDIQYVGIDLSEKAINRARERYSQHVFKIADLTKPDDALLADT